MLSHSFLSYKNNIMCKFVILYEFIVTFTLRLINMVIEENLRISLIICFIFT